MLNRKGKPNLTTSSNCHITQLNKTSGSPPTFLKVFSGQETSRTNFSVSTLSVRSREVSPISTSARLQEGSLLSTPTANSNSIHKLRSNKKHRLPLDDI